MFETIVKESIIVPHGRGVHVIGKNTKGNVRIGDIVTDGNENYVITGIPMFNPMPKRASDEVDVILSAGNADILIGKTLIAI